MAKEKKTVPVHEYNNLLANYTRVCEDLNKPDTEIARLKAHIEIMNEEAKKMHESYTWVCGRLAELERK